jgi:hypothetical protein
LLERAQQFALPHLASAGFVNGRYGTTNVVRNVVQKIQQE